MANKAYQYETSPKKISQNNTRKPEIKKVSKKTKKKTKSKLKVFVICLFAFLVSFAIIYKNSKINESFSKIQMLKTEITKLQKENDQLEIGIQNSLNLNNIEQSAKEMLGMEKLTNKQTIYISLPKKDYIEPKIEEVIIEEKTNIVSSIIEKIKNIF